MYDIARLLKHQCRRLWQLPGTILSLLNGLAGRPPAVRHEAADGSVAAARARFWKDVRDGRREAAARIADSRP